MIYLDNSATTRPDPKAISRMQPYLTDFWTVPSQPHQKGQEILPAIQEAYQQIYALFGAKESDTVLFTSSGAESVNQVIQSTYFDLTVSTGKNQFLTSLIDEASTIRAMGRLEEIGCVPKMIPVNAKGQVTVEALEDLVTPRTALLSLSWANGLTGVCHPIEEIAKFCQERGIQLHLDLTHVLGKQHFSLDELGVDFASFNGDHIHAPKGTGALWIREGVNLSPLIYGGLEQAGLRGGNLNVPGLIALGEAAKECLQASDYMVTEIARLRRKLEQELIKAHPEIAIFSQDAYRIPHVTTLSFPGVFNESLLYLLNQNGLYASIGGGSFQQLGLILKAANVPDPLSQSAINFSLSRETTEQEIDKAVTIISKCYSTLKATSKDLANVT